MKSLFNKYSVAFLVSLVIGLTSCYKKDLDKFKEAGSVKYTPEIALPFLIADVTLADTVPTIPGYTVLRMSDTASVEIPGGKEKDSVESVLDYIEFKVLLENSFPFSGVIQLYFANENGVFIDSLLNNTERVVLAGSASSPINKELTIYVSKARYLQITQSAEKMYLFYDLSTNTSAGLSNSRLRVKIGLKTKLNLDI